MERAPFDQSVLLSMELCAGARLELTERAKYITVVSALEPLADQQPLPDSVARIVTKWVAELGDAPLDASESEDLKASLGSRVRELKRESVRQAIRRTVRALLPGDAAALQQVDDSYGLRSKILHEGAGDPYLHQRTAEIEAILRRLYAAKLGLALRA